MNRFSLPMIALGLLAGLADRAPAQDVHKCVRGGAVTYQATPCPGTDQVLDLPAGPTALEQQQARVNAAADKREAAALQAQQAQPAKPAAKHAPSCAELQSAYADAWGRRNAAVHAGRMGVNWNDAAVSHAQSDINRIQAEAAAQGCKLDS